MVFCRLLYFLLCAQSLPQELLLTDNLGVTAGDGVHTGFAVVRGVVQVVITMSEAVAVVLEVGLALGVVMSMAMVVLLAVEAVSV